MVEYRERNEGFFFYILSTISQLVDESSHYWECLTNLSATDYFVSFEFSWF